MSGQPSSNLEHDIKQTWKTTDLDLALKIDTYNPNSYKYNKK